MRFLVCVIDDGQAEAADRTESATAAEMAAIDTFNERLIADGNWVLAQGLSSPETATVIDNRNDVGQFTDGPYVESREFIAGFWLIDALDRDAALALAAAGSKACNRKVEVREAL